MEIKGKKMLITGASAGLGLETAKLLLEKGAHIYVCSRASKKLEAVREEITSLTCTVLECDVTDAKAVEKLAEEVGVVDVVINNAGVWLDGELETYSYEQISRVIDVNLKGVVNITRAFLPAMKEQDSGYIVNVSSTSGLKGRKGETVYDATKWGVRGFTEALKDELKETKIRVVGFYPGGMNTSLFKKSGSERNTSEFMRVQDVAEVIAFILERPYSMVIDDIKVSRTR